MNRLFFWTADEYACPQWTRKHADKLWHGLGSALLYVSLAFYGVSVLWCVIITFGLGLLWEVIIDCWILGKTEKLYSAIRCTGIRQHGGASKLDILADLLGTVLGVVIVLVK